MCDPITIAGIAATAGSVVVNNMASQRANNAREDVLAAERIRQRGFDDQAQALNTTSQDRYQGFEGQQEIKAQALGDYFAEPSGEPDPNMQTAQTMPSATNDVVVREMNKQSGQAGDFVSQQAQALGNLRAFGDLLGDTSRLQGRDASQIAQIGGFKRGSSGVVPLELDTASRAGDGLKTFGDILGGVGSIATGYGLTSGGLPLFGAAAPAASMTPAVQSAALAARRAATPALYPTTSLLGA